MIEVSKFIGKKVRELREEAGITQKQLGDLLGYSPMGISHFENGIRNLRIDDIKKLADYFKKDIAFFMPNNNSVITAPVTMFRGAGEFNSEIKKSLDDFDKFLESQ